MLSGTPLEGPFTTKRIDSKRKTRTTLRYLYSTPTHCRQLNVGDRYELIYHDLVSEPKRVACGTVLWASAIGS